MTVITAIRQSGLHAVDLGEENNAVLRRYLTDISTKPAHVLTFQAELNSVHSKSAYSLATPIGSKPLQESAANDAFDKGPPKLPKLSPMRIRHNHRASERIHSLSSTPRRITF